MNTTSGPFSKRIQHSKVFKSRFFSNSDHKPWTCYPNIWLVKTLEWQAPVQLPSTPTPRVFLIVTGAAYISPVQMARHCSLLKRLSHSRFIGSCVLRGLSIDVSADIAVNC